MQQADSVHPDEKCWGGYSGPLMRQNGVAQEWRYCQVVRVIRGDEKAEYITDLGPAALFEHIPPHMVASVGTDSVGQVLEMLERHRHDPYWQKRTEEMLAESTLIEEAIRQNEQMHEAIHNRSSFGPMVKVQRNNYSRRRF